MKILIVEDDRYERSILKAELSEHGFLCLTAKNGEEALRLLRSETVELILSDMRMPNMDGLYLLKKVKSEIGNIPFIMLTGAGSVESAVESLKQGALDYIQKPYAIEKLTSVIKRSINYHHVCEENKELKNFIRGQYSFSRIITKSERMHEALDLAKKAASIQNVTVAIFGENGTGKEVIARAIHTEGQGVECRFVAINCAGIPSGLIESELFGHVKGAFTGADKKRTGKFGLAQGGTLLLDEIGDMPIELQAKLLRVLEERTYYRLGSNEAVKANLRIIVATHRNLEEMVKKGAFREDLFHRIHVFPIRIPPLRERREDIPLLVGHFLKHLREELGKPIPGISKKALEVLMKYSWPGNVRELKNCLERAAILANNELIQPEYFNIREDRTSDIQLIEREKENQPTGANTVNFNFNLLEEETSLDNIIEKGKAIVLQHCNNNKTTAAKLLKRARNTFYRKKQGF